jgi:CRP/FNR family transcriptional regulator, anaerobic regulatory protein
MENTCDRHCAHCLRKLCTHAIPIFASLAYEDLIKIAGLTVHKDYAKGDIIIGEGSQPDFVAIVSEGSVKVSKYTLDGREQILYVFAEGDFFGEQNLLFDRPATASVIALEPLKLCLIYKKDFQTLLQASPDIGIKIINELGERLARLESAVQNMGVRSLEARISSALLEFADRYGTPHRQGTLIHLPLSREGLASYIGIARETVSRKLSLLEEEGVIRAIGNKQLLILRRDALEEAAGVSG